MPNTPESIGPDSVTCGNCDLECLSPVGEFGDAVALRDGTANAPADVPDHYKVKQAVQACRQARELGNCVLAAGTSA